MWLTVLYLFHEYVAKNTIPNYKILFEAREAANQLFEIYENQLETFYELTSPLMILYQDMLLIFQNWHKQLFPYTYALAQAGFYFTGQSGITLCVSLAI